MPKADRSHNTATGAPSTLEPVSTIAPSRRRLLAGSGLATALAVIGVSASAAPPIAEPDPVLAIYAEWRAIEDEVAVVDRRHAELRAGFVQRHGEVLREATPRVQSAWNADPLYLELDAARERSDDLCDRSTDLLDVMMDTPATSIKGIYCKVLAGLSVCAFIEHPSAHPEYHETMTLAVLRDAARVIGERVGA